MLVIVFKLGALSEIFNFVKIYAMKTKANSLLIAFLMTVMLNSFSSNAQEVILNSVQVISGYPETEKNQTFQFGLIVLTDVSTFTENLDKTKTRFTKITDDTGFDLLAAQKQWEEESKGNYWHTKATLENWGLLSEDEGSGFIVNGKLSVRPSAGAKTVNVQGVIAMVNITNKESSYGLKEISTADKGSKTEIGQVSLYAIGALESEGVTYEIYEVISDGKSISSAELVGGDDREEAAKIFKVEVSQLELAENAVIYKILPETIDLKVMAKDTEVFEIPFDLNLSVGF